MSVTRSGSARVKPGFFSQERDLSPSTRNGRLVVLQSQLVVFETRHDFAAVSPPSSRIITRFDCKMTPATSQLSCTPIRLYIVIVAVIGSHPCMPQHKRRIEWPSSYAFVVIDCCHGQPSQAAEQLSCCNCTAVFEALTPSFEPL